MLKKKKLIEGLKKLIEGLGIKLDEGPNYFARECIFHFQSGSAVFNLTLF